MAQHHIVEALQRVAYREFLLEPDLAPQVGLEDLPSRIATLLSCGEEDAVARLTASPTLETLTLDQLKTLLAIRDMTLVSRTAAAVAAELKADGATYEDCCRTALTYLVVGSMSHAFSALRAAAAKNDRWARHHYLYGLALGIEGNTDRARWELGMALQYEPYEEGRRRIRLALDGVEA